MLSRLPTYKDWLPGVAGTQPRLGPVLGGRLIKGGLHQPPFYFAQTLFPNRPPESDVSCCRPANYKKMSRQWGHWRLGRGDGGHYSEVQSRGRGLRTCWGVLSAAVPTSTSTAQMVRITAIMAYSLSNLSLHPSSFPGPLWSLARRVHFCQYSLAPLGPPLLVPAYHHYPSGSPLFGRTPGHA
jgi:hypothetical protein